MRILLLSTLSLFTFNMSAQSVNPFLYSSSINRQDVNLYPVYAGSDLGTTYSTFGTTVKIWAPTMQQMKLHLYDGGSGGKQVKEFDMTKTEQGVWTVLLKGNQAGRFFTLSVYDGSNWSAEITDPSSRAVGVNGLRSAIINPDKTSPRGWARDKSPDDFFFKSKAILYELHVRDATIQPGCGVPDKLRGKFLGLTVPGTVSIKGQPTGLSHLKALGVTHIQLLPFYDFYTVDESKPDKPQYNWGYDPLHYNVPEGSYSTDAADPVTRIRELKQMIQTFHKNGLRVVMDVVYNHTMLGDKSNFNILVPGYYYRTNPDGSFANASACGNETASDAPMFRKFMLESLVYWVKEFHIDGFRFDLMAIHDKETMNLISRKLRSIKSDILLHGEGWSAGSSPLAEESRAVKRLAYQLDGIGVFSDEVRDGMKGGWSNEKDNGFVSGKAGMEESIKYGIVGAVKHPDIDYNKVNYSKTAFAKEATQCIVYNECHDNHTLWDRLLNSNPNDSEADRKKMYKLAQFIVLTSQGIPFIHAGQEMYRTKNGIDNSYNQPDSINQFDWNRLAANTEMLTYTQQLIALRKSGFYLMGGDSANIARRLRFLPQTTPGLIGYTMTGKGKQVYLVLMNANKEKTKVTLPAGGWQVLMNGDQPGDKGKNVYQGDYWVNGITGVVMIQGGGVQGKK